MNAVSICAVWNHRKIAVAMNSGPLSDRGSAAPRARSPAATNTSITRPERMLLATSKTHEARLRPWARLRAMLETRRTEADGHVFGSEVGERITWIR